MSISVGIDIGASAVKVAVVRIGVPEDGARGARHRRRRGRRAASRRRFAPRSPRRSAGSRADAIATSPSTAPRRGAHARRCRPARRSSSPRCSRSSSRRRCPFEMSESVFDYRVLAEAARAKPRPHGSRPCSPSSRGPRTCARGSTSSRRRSARSRSASASARSRSRTCSRTRPRSREPGPIVVVDLGTRSSEVLVLADGEPVFARTALVRDAGAARHSAPSSRASSASTIAAYRAAGGDAAHARVSLRRRRVRLGRARRSSRASSSCRSSSFRRRRSTCTALGPERAARAAAVREGDRPRARPRRARAGLNLRQGPLAFERGFAWVREKIPSSPGSPRSSS